MASAIITDELADRVVLLLEAEIGFRKENVSCEIQDDFQFLLVCIRVDELIGSDQLPSYEKAVSLLNQLIPSRKGNYSWMVNFMNEGMVVDSYFGGDSNCPNSGL